MRAILLGLLGTATTAAAQAPGEVQPITAPEPSVMDRRWSFAMSLGSLGLAPDREDADTVSFGMVELAGRYRLRPFLELGLSLYGGGAMKGELSTAGGYIDGRYRFLADRPWNVFAGLSLGLATVANEDASEEARAGRGSLRISLGLERRFRAFAIAAEARLVAIGKNDDFMPTDATPAAEMAKAQLGGGSVIVGGVYYF